MDTSSGGLGSWCTSRICARSAAEVAAHVEQRIVLDPRFTAAGSWLEVTAPAGAVASVGAPRRHAARLRFSRWRRPARVTLEIERWSIDRCELVIRPGRRAPFRSDVYLEAALALVESVARDVEVAGAAAPRPDAAGRGGLRRAS